MDYKSTVFLPKTSFSMKARLAQREPDFVKYWKDIGLYKRLRQNSKGKKKFILHFGPPFANGHIHIGHALTIILKDIINKTYQMLGFEAPLVPGWDCHGLPIEWKIEEKYRAKGKSKDEIPPLSIIRDCRSFAKKWMEVQKEEFKRLGVIADWENPYVTMNPQTEAHIAGQLLVMLEKDLLYKGLKPVLWSIVEKTALAEAEVEYKEHTSDAVDVAFKIVKSKDSLYTNAYVVIWTTTPWTLPSNRAIAYNPSFKYCLIKISSFDNPILVAYDLKDQFCERIKCRCNVIEIIKGDDLEGIVCEHPFRKYGYDFSVPLLPGDHVTADTGTGFVHTAPSHGIEDFELAQKYGIEVRSNVKDDGTYEDHVSIFKGKSITTINPKIIEYLNSVNALLFCEKIRHSYPHSWRSKTPLIYRVTTQWFLRIDILREKALKALSNVKWFPKQGENRIRSMIENRPDWCLSRQRVWGVPLTLFINKKTGEFLIDHKVNERIVKLISIDGVEAWRKYDVKDFLGDNYNDKEYEKVHDILDVWFESGCSHDFVLRKRDELSWPADVYLEGSDQHRGWFQSSLFHSCAIYDKAPYRQVVTHGFVLDGKGYKMSKSLNNVIPPHDVISKMGADILRLWVVNSDYTQDLRIGDEILEQQEDVYRRFRNTLRYLLGGLKGYNYAIENIEYQFLPSLEKLMLHQLFELKEYHMKCLKQCDLADFYAVLHTFCTNELSAFYFDVRKDVLYCDGLKSLQRCAARTVMNEIFLNLLHWIAPVLSFTAEEAWLIYNNETFNDAKESIHEQLFPKQQSFWRDIDLEKRWDSIKEVRRVINYALEVERAAKVIGSSLQADIVVYINNARETILNDIDLAELSITSSATTVVARPPAGSITLDSVEHVGVIVNPALGQKCARCWRIMEEVGKQEREGEKRVFYDICYRCEDVLKLNKI
ncbi:MAG: isoleucine--tRNA ligase [Alphaproteobacteria bacterium]